MALLLNKKAIKGKVVYRSIFVVAMALPQFVSLLVVRSMFDRYGIVNNILLELGWLTERFDFWSDGTAAKILILVVNMWVGIPYYMLLMSGLLLNIPKDQYEAADIDGAGPLTVFFKIELPLIMTQVRINLILMVIGTVQSWENIYLFLGVDGGPNGVGTVPGLMIFREAFSRGLFGYGCAIGFVIFVVTLLLTLINNKFVRVNK